MAADSAGFCTVFVGKAAAWSAWLVWSEHTDAWPTAGPRASRVLEVDWLGVNLLSLGDELAGVTPGTEHHQTQE